MQGIFSRGEKSIESKIKKKVMSHVVTAVTKTSKGEGNRHSINKKGGGAMQRKLVISEMSFEFNEDIATVVERFSGAVTRHVNEEEKSVGLVEDDAVGFLNRIKRGLNTLSGGDGRGGRRVIVPHSEFYLNEKSRIVYERYVIFLFNLLHEMGFSSERIVRLSHPSNNANKFIFIVSLLQWLAASVLSQQSEVGLTPLLEEFAGDLLLESKLLANKGWLSAKSSVMYSALIERQPRYIQLIKARRAEEQLSKTAIKSINDGLELLDRHEKIIQCFLLADVDFVYHSLSLTPKDLDSKTYKASFYRLYAALTGEHPDFYDINLEKLRIALGKTREYVSHRAVFETLINLLKDIAVLRKFLNALASLHETTGWLIIGMSSSVNMKALQSAFFCFHQRFKQAQPIFQGILKDLHVDSQCVSVYTECQKIWSRRTVGEIQLSFEKISSDDVVNYVRREIEGALLAIQQAQSELFSRGLSKESIFLRSDPLYSPPTLPATIDVAPTVIEHGTSQLGCSFGLLCFSLGFSGLLCVGAFYLLAFFQIAVPPAAIIAAVCLLVLIVCFTLKYRYGKPMAQTYSYQGAQNKFPKAQYFVPAVKSVECQFNALLDELSCESASSHVKAKEQLATFFSQFGVLKTTQANDPRLWAHIASYRDKLMANTSRHQQYQFGLTLSSMLSKRDSGDLLGAVDSLLAYSDADQPSIDFSPVVF